MAKDKERKLTKQELKRKESFEQKCAELESDGFEREELTMGVVTANILALVIMLPFALLFLFIYLHFNNGSFHFTLIGFNALLYFPAIILLLVAHEGIHGLVWGLCCKNRFKSIEFGVIWSMLTPYCTCSEPLKKSKYVIGAAMPTIILGFLLSIIATIMNSALLLILALIMIFGGGGDALIICKLLMHRTAGYNVIYLDHPYELGLVAFKKPL